MKKKLPQPPKLIPIDLSRINRNNINYITHPDINTRSTYLVKFEGKWFVGKFYLGLYGLGFRGNDIDLIDGNFQQIFRMELSKKKNKKIWKPQNLLKGRGAIVHLQSNAVGPTITKNSLRLHSSGY